MQHCNSKDIPEGTSLSERKHRKVNHHGGMQMLYHDRFTIHGSDIQ